MNNTNKEQFVPFFLEVRQKRNRYDIYIVNNTNKEYFVYRTYTKELIKANDKFLLEKRAKDENNSSISLWLTDDISETYLLSYENIYSDFRHTKKFENCFNRVEKLIVHDKSKDKKLEQLAKYNYKLTDVINIDTKKLLNHLKSYLEIYEDYQVKHKYNSMIDIIDMFQTLSIIVEASNNSNEFIIKLKKLILKSSVHMDKEKLEFLTNSQEQKNEMLVSVEISCCQYCFYEMLQVDLIKYFEEKNYSINSEKEVRVDRHYCRKSHIITNKNDSFIINSIYNWDDVIDYYIVVPMEIFKKYILEFVQKNKKAPFRIKYISKEDKTPYILEKENIRY